MARYCMFLILLCNLNLFCFAKNLNLQYNINHIQNPDVSSLKVKLSFEPNKNGTTKLFFENEFFGEKDLFNCLTSIRLLNEKGEFILNKEENFIEIKHRRGLKLLIIEYLLQQDNGNDIQVNEPFRPVISENYFRVFSNHLFIVPESQKKLDITILWEDFSGDYTVHNSFGSNEKTQRINNISTSDFFESVFVGGDYQVSNILIKGKKVYIASRGNWDKFNPDQIIELCSKVISTLRNFWNDHQKEYFTIILSPVEIEGFSMSLGTSLHNSFEAVASTNLDLIDIASLFCHEINHDWIGGKIQNDNEEQQYWFSEGFTEYYTIKLMSKYKIGDYSNSSFIEKINNIIRNHWESNYRTMPNSSITYDSFWGDPEYEKLPYNRGALFAFYLDRKISKDSNGKHNLDNVMMEFLNNSDTKNKKITHNYFKKTVNKYVAENIDDFFYEYIEKGKLLPLTDFFKEVNLDFKPKIIELKTLGLELNETFKIINVEENSQAKRAGFKIGDVITVYEKDPKPDELATYEVLRGGEAKIISLIREKSTFDIPQLEINEHNIGKMHL